MIMRPAASNKQPVSFSVPAQVESVSIPPRRNGFGRLRRPSPSRRGYFFARRGFHQTTALKSLLFPRFAATVTTIAVPTLRTDYFESLKPAALVFGDIDIPFGIHRGTNSVKELARKKEPRAVTDR